MSRKYSFRNDDLKRYGKDTNQIYIPPKIKYICFICGKEFDGNYVCYWTCKYSTIKLYCCSSECYNKATNYDKECLRCGKNEL